MGQNDEVFGFDELVTTMDKMSKKYPEKAEALLMAQGRIATNRVRSKTPVGKTRKLRGSWRLKRPKKYGKALVVRTQSTAPHGHLVEQGHEIVRGGRTSKRGRSISTLERRVRGIQSKGRVEGKKMLESTFEELQGSFHRSAEKLLDDLTKEMEV